MNGGRFRQDEKLACGLSFHQRIAITLNDDDDDGRNELNTNAWAISFFFLLTLFFISPSFFVPFFASSFPLSFLFPHGGHTSPRRKAIMSMSTMSEKKTESKRTRVKDDCMSNLRHGDYNYVTFALVLLLHSFFAQPSSNPIRRTRLFLLCVRACMCACVCAYIYIHIYIYINVCMWDRTCIHLLLSNALNSCPSHLFLGSTFIYSITSQ